MKIAISLFGFLVLLASSGTTLASPDDNRCNVDLQCQVIQELIRDAYLKKCEQSDHAVSSLNILVKLDDQGFVTRTRVFGRETYYSACAIEVIKELQPFYEFRTLPGAAYIDTRILFLTSKLTGHVWIHR